MILIISPAAEASSNAYPFTASVETVFTALPVASEVTAPFVNVAPASTSKIPKTPTGANCPDSVSTSKTPYALTPAVQRPPSNPINLCLGKSAVAFTESIKRGLYNFSVIIYYLRQFLLSLFRVLPRRFLLLNLPEFRLLFQFLLLLWLLP